MFKVFGLVTVDNSGTKVRATKNQADPTADYPVHSYRIVAKETNTGQIFIGDSTLDKSTGAGIMAVLPKPTVSNIPQLKGTASYEKLNELWIDAEKDGDGVYVSCEKSG